MNSNPSLKRDVATSMVFALSGLANSRYMGRLSPDKAYEIGHVCDVALGRKSTSLFIANRLNPSELFELFELFELLRRVTHGTEAAWT